MILIGLAGTLGAGKSTVGAYICERYGFDHYSTSEYLADEAERRGMGRDREARRNVANSMREKSPTALVEAVFESAREAQAEKVVLDPLHTVAEVEFVKKNNGIVIAVDSDFRQRYERIVRRGSEKDNVTYDEFVRAQELEMSSRDPNKNNIGAAIAASDAVIVNNGTTDELYGQVDDVLRRFTII